MSSGMLVLAPGALTHLAVAPSAGSVLSGIAATSLIARVAVAGPEALANGLRDARHLRLHPAGPAEASWEATARAAIQANSEVRVLQAALRRAGDPAGLLLPPPVRLDGRSLGDVLADAEKVTGELDAARAYLAEHRRRTARRIAGSGRRRPPSHPPALAAGRPVDPGVPVEVDQLLATVPEDAEPDELADVYAAAAAARTAPAFWLPQLAMVVEQLRTNGARTRRRATEAAGYVEGIVAIDVDPADPHVQAVVAALDEVVARQRDLSESLRDEARLMIANGERTAAGRLLADRLRDRLRADGFQLRTVGDPGEYEVIELTSPGRPEQAAYVRVGRGEISYRTVVRRADQHRTDAEWCEAVEGSIARYGRQLSDSGIGVHAVERSRTTGDDVPACVTADLRPGPGDPW
jgi:hypothetical protein